MRGWAAASILLLVGTLADPGATSQVSPHLSAALEEQQRLASERPYDAGLLNDLANLLSLAGELEAAEQAYGQALELDPGYLAAHFNLGLLQQQLGELEAAADEFRAALGIDPGHAWSHYQLGSVYELLGQRQAALSHYGRAFTLDPDLLFPEINPHIIENQLVTEALLLARRGRQARTPSPKAYSEPQRIESMLLPAPQEAAPAPPEGLTEPSRMVPPRLSTDPAADAEAEPEASGPDAAGASSPAAAPQAGLVVVPEDRVLDSSDLRGGVRNQLDEGSPSLSSGPARRGAGGALVPAPRQPTVVQPPARGDQGRPGLGSTGALEWSLEGPRLASRS